MSKSIELKKFGFLILKEEIISLEKLRAQNFSILFRLEDPRENKT